jgi:hypothetical protein
MSTPFGEAIELFVERTPEWIKDAGDHAKLVAARIEDGAYAADSDMLVADAARGLALVVHGFARMATTVLDGATIIAIPPDPVRVVRSRAFPVPGPADSERALSVAEPLTSGSGVAIPDDDVEFDPPKLPAAVNRFNIVVRARALPGVAYFGIVMVTDPKGQKVPVQVVVQL